MQNDRSFVLSAAPIEVFSQKQVCSHGQKPHLDGSFGLNGELNRLDSIVMAVYI